MKETVIRDRRAFVAAAGIGVLAALLPEGNGSEAAARSPEDENIALVNDFCLAWATRNVEKILGFLARECVYRMTETTPPATGHAEIAARIKTFLDTSTEVEFKVLDTYAKGPMVVNHRIDKFVGERSFTWEGVGVFFVKDGKIGEWQDYTIKLVR